jgi:putative CocE/NonD family hydrolase
MAHVNGPDDYSSIQLRNDVLVYVTSPLENDVEITGPIKLILFASSSAVDADFAALCFDLHPGGFAQRLTDSIVRARYRDGMKNPSLIEPGQIYKYEINLWHMSQVLFKGHRIGIQIASSAFPKFERNASTGENIATRTRLESAKQTIYHDKEHPSALILSIVPKKDNS